MSQHQILLTFAPFMRMQLDSDEPVEPRPKRARFNTASSPIPPAASDPSSCVKLRARDVVELRFVTSVSDIADGAVGKHDPSMTHSPTFLHQIFPHEEIKGYSSATLAVYVDPLTLFIWLDEYTEPLRGTKQRTHLKSKLAHFINAGLCSTRADFATALRSRHMYVPPVRNSISVYNASGNRFEIFKENFNSVTVKELHRRISFFMFVHTNWATLIDESDPRWEIFLVYKQNTPRQFVAYLTMYPFALLRNEKNIDSGFGDRLRISHIFVMPAHQGFGHEARLLEAVYKDAVTRNALEVTVQNPTPRISLVRDLMDLERAYSEGILQYRAIVPYDRITEVMSSLCATLLITRKQARRCLEMQNLMHMNFKNSIQARNYRLWVKRRLSHDCVDLLDFHERMGGKEGRKAMLAELFEICEIEYNKIADLLADRSNMPQMQF